MFKTIHVCAYTYITTVNEKGSHEFERKPEGIFEGLEGGKEGGCDVIIVLFQKSGKLSRTSFSSYSLKKCCQLGVISRFHK